MTTIAILTPDHPGYADLVAHLTSEPLRTQWAEDAESQHDEGTSYVVVYAEGPDGNPTPAAWAGYRFEDHADAEHLRCCSNYVDRRFRDRDPDLYALAYHTRHRDIVLNCRLPAVTYLYRQPLRLHIEDGWYFDNALDGRGMSVGPGEEPHEWWRLLRHPNT